MQDIAKNATIVLRIKVCKTPKEQIVSVIQPQFYIIVQAKLNKLSRFKPNLISCQAQTTLIQAKKNCRKMSMLSYKLAGNQSQNTYVTWCFEWQHISAYQDLSVLSSFCVLKRSISNFIKAESRKYCLKGIHAK